MHCARWLYIGWLWHAHKIKTFKKILIDYTMLEYSCSLLILAIICSLKIQEWIIINDECLLAQTICTRNLLCLHILRLSRSMRSLMKIPTEEPNMAPMTPVITRESESICPMSLIYVPLKLSLQKKKNKL